MTSRAAAPTSANGAIVRSQGPPPVELAEAFERCAEITRRRARNFWYGLRLTPEPARSAMFAIYAWMRQADDLADGGADGKTDSSVGGSPDGGTDNVLRVGKALPDAAERRARVEALRARTGRLFRGEPGSEEDRRDPVWVAMASVARRHRLDRAPFDAMLDGQIEDIDGRTYRTWDELRSFCERVASTVGVISITIWGYDDPRARDLAIDRGVAFQLTNILRDFREDRERGRVYLPSDEMATHGLDADALMRWDPAPACSAFVLAQVDRADGLYRRSAALDGMISPGCVPTLWAMTSIYRGLLDRIATGPHRIVGHRRIRLSSFTKAWIALRARRIGRTLAPRDVGAPSASPSTGP